MKKFLLLLLLLGASLQAESNKLFVSLDGTRLLTKPAAFSRATGLLKKGTLVLAEEPHNGYIKVVVSDAASKLNGQGGYLSVRAIQKSKPKLSANAKRSSDASSEEVAAATKGFNKQVEADLRKDPNNEKGYQTLDKSIDRTKVEDPQGGLEGFREKGKVGEFKEGGE